MSRPIIELDNISKLYKLGQFNARTLRDEVENFFTRSRRKRAGGETHGNMDLWALQDVSLSFQPGEIVGVIGRNGAGKSTLLKILSRVTAPTRGTARLRGRVASLLEVGTGFHQELTGRENIYLNGAILGMTKREVRAKFDQIVEFSGVARFIDTPVKRYSSGMYVRLAFAVAAHLDPEILIVDEVLAVGDAEFQKKCLGAMEAASTRDGRTVLFVSHNMSAVRDLCSRAIILDAGQVKCDGKPAPVIDEYLSRVAGNPDTDLTKVKQLGPKRCIRLTRCCFFNESGVLSTTFTMGKAFVARIFFQVTSPAKRLEAGVKISSRYGAPIHYLTSSWEGCAPDLDPGMHCLQVTVPSLLLYPGTYLIGLWISQNGEPHSDVNVQDVISIQVLKATFNGNANTTEQYGVSGGEVYVPCEWVSLPVDTPVACR